MYIHSIYMVYTLFLNVCTGLYGILLPPHLRPDITGSNSVFVGPSCWSPGPDWPCGTFIELRFGQGGQDSGFKFKFKFGPNRLFKFAARTGKLNALTRPC